MPRNRFRQPMQLGGPVRQPCLSSGCLGWQNRFLGIDPELLKRLQIRAQGRNVGQLCSIPERVMGSQVDSSSKSEGFQLVSRAKNKDLQLGARAKNEDIRRFSGVFREEPKVIQECLLI
jgi:hypothetical protein